MFITEWGRYVHLRAPQGWKGSGDLFTRRYDDLTQDFKDKVKIVDDSLLHQTSIEKAFFQCWDYLTLLAEHGVVANKKKFRFGRQTVEFAGLMITPTGIEPSPKILAAIENFPTPTNITNARSWFGLVNQVSWAYAISPLMQPFRDLIKPNKTFYWDEQLEQLFQDSKQKLIAAVKDGVKTFDCNKPTCLQTDWSKEGIGYLLLQQHCSCKSAKAPLCCPDGWKLVYAGSRVTQPSESRYSPTEGEALAVSWALHHSRLFTLGCKNLLTSVDHKPLLGIFKNRSLDSIDNPRILNLKESTLRWDFGISHNPGKWHKGPDALSRSPSASVAHFEVVRDLSFYNPICEYTTMEDIQAANSRDEYVRAVAATALHSLTNCTTSHDDIRRAATSDPSYNQLVQQIQQGFPSSKHATPPNLREYWEVRQRLSTIDGVALLDQRTVIPQSLRRQMLESLHSAHQGVTGMKARANQSIYWPGMDASIKQYKETCSYCLTNAPSQPKEPLILSPSPEYPFQQICMDYFEINRHSYLVTVDRFSGWPCIYHFPGQATSRLLIKTCRDLFIAYGVPEEVGSDGGPQFKAEVFKDFLQNWGIHHRKSSADYPQSNGRAELGVKAAKRIISDNASPDGSINNDKVAIAILQYRNTPLRDINLSPAQILFHRQLRDSLPNNPRHYQLHKDWIISARQREDTLSDRNRVLTEKYNASARELPPLSEGTSVVIQNRRHKRKWTKAGKIVESLGNRQYRIKLEGSGRLTLQNRRFIRKSIPLKPTITPSASPPATSQPADQSLNNTPHQPPSVQNNDVEMPPTVQQEMNTQLNPQQPMNSQQQVNTGSSNAKVHRSLKNLMSYNNTGRKDIPQWREREM